MIRGSACGEMYRSLGPRRFVHKLNELLGLEDAAGNRNYCPVRGRNVLESAQIRPDEISILDLAQGITGATGDELNGLLKTPPGKLIDVMEAGEAIVPSAFANVSAFNSAVAGLLEVKLLESYARAEYLADQLCETIPTNKRSEKFIGISTIGDEAVERKPGRPHKRVAVSERYATTPETVNRGIAVEVTREAVMFDLTRDLLRQCEAAADTLALRKEYLVLDVVLGITNTYTYGGTSYNTYVASGGGWVNYHQNPFTNWADIDDALQLFGSMTDPETGEPIAISPQLQILCMPAKWMLMKYHLSATLVSQRTADWPVSRTADVAEGANPLASLGLSMVNGPTYPYAYRRAIAADGLALSAANAGGLWFIGDFKRAFAWMQNLPLTIERASPSDYQMADHGLVFALFADEMGVAAVKDPRFVIKNRVEA